ncbi:MAG TPA: 16S rRNA (cytosine(1402)-N(4))-methyltransferase RsmH [Gemmatimonadaceae bacterium]|nr:16S rRNA (cytosine(1402)-N(4))-methyltransferase RsmH [Gemmatimonadaceae bacterium]
MLAPRTDLEALGGSYHTPVLAGEVVRWLGGSREILDGTLGGGGHALLLLERGARVTALDRDPEAVAAARERLALYERAGRFRAISANYASVDELPELDDVRFDGILLDLGVSSHQLDDTTRGFSFRPSTPLDMRMGPDARLTAAECLAEASEEQLARLFATLADEPHARRLAREIVRRRASRPLETSDDLVGAIRGALGPRTGPADFARLFQAVRIAVNDELEGLARALPHLRDRLTPGGRMVVIAYHSGEDRVVKQAFRAWSAACVCPPKQPVCTCRGAPLGETLTRRAVKADAPEVASNPRARSARLRAWQRAE